MTHVGTSHGACYLIPSFISYRLSPDTKQIIINYQLQCVTEVPCSLSHHVASSIKFSKHTPSVIILITQRLHSVRLHVGNFCLPLTSPFK